MRKKTQISINNECNIAFNKAVNEITDKTPSKRLKTCKAFVYETDNYYVLQSYETFIACIDKKSDICYDCLRTEYGYTQTSAKHVSIFRKSNVYGGYSKHKYGCETVLTTRKGE